MTDSMGWKRCLDGNVSYDHQVIFLASYEDLLRPGV
jgi:hypothetical protein